MGALTRHPVNDFITLGNDILNGRVEIREGREHHVEKHAGTHDSRRHSRTNGMVDKVWTKMGEGTL
jgi:hypothetical protein